MEHAPGGRGHGPGDRPPDGCTHARTLGVLTPDLRDPELGDSGGPAAGAGDTPPRRAWVLMPLDAPPQCRPGRGPVRQPGALTRAPVDPKQAAPGIPGRLLQNV